MPKPIKLKGLSYAELLALEVIKKRRTLKEIEIQIKGYRSWKTFYAVLRAYKKMKGRV